MKREYGRSFKSEYHGSCLDCKRGIRPGQSITSVNPDDRRWTFTHTRHTPQGRVATVGLVLLGLALLLCVCAAVFS